MALPRASFHGRLFSILLTVSRRPLFLIQCPLEFQHHVVPGHQKESFSKMTRVVFDTAFRAVRIGPSFEQSPITTEIKPTG